MIHLLAALAVSAASTNPSATLVSTAPWWEKVTVTIMGDGKAQSCRYESSLRPDSKQSCEVAGGSSSAAAGSVGSKGEYTRITFERRYHPGPTLPAAGSLYAGDTLLGRQVMALAIDSAGAVKGCKIVAMAGEMTTDYGCDEAKAERFEASAATDAAAPRQGYMTVLVYGHSEHVV